MFRINVLQERDTYLASSKYMSCFWITAFFSTTISCLLYLEGDQTWQYTGFRPNGRVPITNMFVLSIFLYAETTYMFSSSSIGSQTPFSVQVP